MRNPVAGRAHPKMEAKEQQSRVDRSLQQHQQPDESEAEFHGGWELSERKWDLNLKRICATVQKPRAQHEVSTPIRVAILDTGCDTGLVFPGNGSPRPIWKDYVQKNNETPLDSYGHGTLMIRLVQECSPCAEFIVARVAEDTKGLKKSQLEIAGVRLTSFSSITLDFFFFKKKG